LFVRRFLVHGRPFFLPANPQKSHVARSGAFIAGQIALKYTLRVHLRAHFDSVNLGQTVFEFSFSKSSGTYRQSREVPLPEPELITNVYPTPWFSPEFVINAG
jgi:hypothetical protein